MSSRATPTNVFVAHHNKTIFIVLIIILTALITDTAIVQISAIVGQTVSDWRINVFVVVVAISIIGQFFILKIIKQKKGQIGQKLNLKLMHRAVTILQCAITAIVSVVVVEVFLLGYYNVILLTSCIVVSYSLSIAMMGLLTQRFLTWFMSNRNSIVLLYGLSSIMITVNAVFTIAFVTWMFQYTPTEGRSHLSGLVPNIEPGSVADNLNRLYVITAILSFITTWIATVMLLHHYSKTLGRTKYWITLCVPLAYFISQFMTLFVNIFDPLLVSNPIFYGILFTVFFTLSKPIGGILFGVSFWTMTKNIDQGNIVRDYIIISAIGFVLLFTSNQAIILLAISYPPFGLATIIFMGLGSYLIFVGIYSSVISMSEDSMLRQLIRKVALKETTLLDSMSTAQMEQEIQKRMLVLTRKTRDLMTDETGIQSSLSDDDMKQYLRQVIEEVRKTKNQFDRAG